MKFIYIILLVFFLGSCKEVVKATEEVVTNNAKDTTIDPIIPKEKPVDRYVNIQEINAGSLLADSVVSFAETLTGIPYKYASIDPAVGFDCSGFITYTFSHFGITVPRSSKDFENVGETVMLLNAKRGDLVLFTGTDSTDNTIGHMGIITSNNNGEIRFIHSTSGKANGVTETLLNEYYIRRYVKKVRVFNL